MPAMTSLGKVLYEMLDNLSFNKYCFAFCLQKAEQCLGLFLGIKGTYTN